MLKYQKRLPIFNGQIVSLYANGMTVRDIQRPLQSIYGVAVSPELISRVTDSVLSKVREWRSRPVDAIFPIVCMDGLTGLPDAVRVVFPDTRIQLCIVHMVRNNTKFVSYAESHKKPCGFLHRRCHLHGHVPGNTQDCEEMDPAHQ